jgi:hypothetical protein
MLDKTCDPRHQALSEACASCKDPSCPLVGQTGKDLSKSLDRFLERQRELHRSSLPVVEQKKTYDVVLTYTVRVVLANDIEATSAIEAIEYARSRVEPKIHGLSLMVPDVAVLSVPDYAPVEACVYPPDKQPHPEVVKELLDGQWYKRGKDGEWKPTVAVELGG